MLGAIRTSCSYLRSFPSTARSRQARCGYSQLVDTDLKFSYLYPPNTKINVEELLQKLQSPALSLRNSHDAAVVLATPDLAKQITSQDFLGKLVGALSASSSNVEAFTLLGAVVDGLPPPPLPGKGFSRTMSGLSVIRGHAADLMPHIALPESAPARKHKLDQDLLSSLTFHLGWPSVTVPLARTTFINHKHSTLLASSWELRKGSHPPTHLRTVERSSVKVFSPRPSESSPQTMRDIAVWAPAIPITTPRAITESFGNIIKGVAIDDEAAPASIELEAAVDNIFSQIAPADGEAGPIGVWALVTPADVPQNPELATPWDGKKDMLEVSKSTSELLKHTYRNGGRFFKVLSGGGGWGAKKGLLSLDPQESHVPLSEEEEMDRFVKTMEASSFAPPGSFIQFFVSAPTAPGVPSLPDGIVLGVSSAVQPSEGELGGDGQLVPNHFGAMTSGGLFLESSLDKIAGIGGLSNTKLTVPQSLVYVA